MSSNTNTKPSNQTLRVIAAIGLSLVVLALFSRGGSNNATPTAPTVKAPPPPKWDTDSGRIDAFVKSQTFMKRQLKAPSTASFPYITDSEVKVSHQGNGKFLVKAYVDAQNSFGAQIRTHYLCELQDKGDGTWSLISLNTN